MVKARCPDCDELVQIHDTGEKQHPDRSSHWWTFVLHKQPDKPEICQGSGKRV